MAIRSCSSSDRVASSLFSIFCKLAFRSGSDCSLIVCCQSTYDFKSLGEEGRDCSPRAKSLPSSSPSLLGEGEGVLLSVLPSVIPSVLSS